VVLLIGVASMPPLLQAAQDDVYVEPAKRYARLTKVLPPEYPSSALLAGRQAIVDVEGVIGPLQFMELPRITSSSNDAAPFIDAVAEALPYWRFRARTGNDCLPSAQPMRVRVHFEIDGGKPRIFVEHAKDPEPGPPSDAASHERYKPISRTEPKYPRDMILKNMMAAVYAIVSVAPSGEVTKVQTRSFILLPAVSQRTLAENDWMKRQDEQAREVSLAPFEHEVEKAFLRWKYPPLADGQTRRICQDVLFTLKD